MTGESSSAFSTYFFVSMLASAMVLAAVVVCFVAQSMFVLYLGLVLPLVVANGLVAAILRLRAGSSTLVLVLACVHGVAVLGAIAAVIGFLSQKSFRLFD